MKNKYILDGTTPVACTDLVQWAMWLDTTDRTIAYTEVDADKIIVSTVFVGMDTSVVPSEDPLLFETMIIGGWLDRTVYKSSTWEEAEKTHELQVTMAANPPGHN